MADSFKTNMVEFKQPVGGDGAVVDDYHVTDIQEPNDDQDAADMRRLGKKQHFRVWDIGEELWITLARFAEHFGIEIVPLHLDPRFDLRRYGHIGRDAGIFHIPSDQWRQRCMTTSRLTNFFMLGRKRHVGYDLGVYRHLDLHVSSHCFYGGDGINGTNKWRYVPRAEQPPRKELLTVTSQQANTTGCLSLVPPEHRGF